MKDELDQHNTAPNDASEHDAHVAYFTVQHCISSPKKDKGIKSSVCKTKNRKRWTNARK